MMTILRIKSVVTVPVFGVIVLLVVTRINVLWIVLSSVHFLGFILIRPTPVEIQSESPNSKKGATYTPYKAADKKGTNIELHFTKHVQCSSILMSMNFNELKLFIDNRNTYFYQ